MASTNYTYAFNNSTAYGQPSYLSYNGNQSNMSMAYPTQSAMFQCTPTSAVSTNSWNTYGDVQLSQDSFYDYDAQSFTTDEETSSVASSLHTGSKKISKASPSNQVQGTNKASQKRNKRGRNPWTPKEDAKLMELMKKYGQSWAMISSVMEGRTGKQVRDRYLNKLRPNIKLGDWSPQEDELLVTLCKEIGNRWSLIANHLPGRTEGQVKNRFYSHIKKRLQPDGTYNPNLSSTSSSEGVNSLTTSPQGEEFGFDFGQEFDANMFNSAMPIPNFMQAKTTYVIDNEDLSEQSTTQGTTSQKDSYSPLNNDLVDPTDVISYDLPLQRDNSFFIPSMINDSHVDEILNGVSDYLNGNTTKVNNSSEVESFFVDEVKTPASQQADTNERLSQLNKRKAYLELALAKTLKEMKGF